MTFPIWYMHGCYLYWLMADQTGWTTQTVRVVLNSIWFSYSLSLYRYSSHCLEEDLWSLSNISVTTDRVSCLTSPRPIENLRCHSALANCRNITWDMLSSLCIRRPWLITGKRQLVYRDNVHRAFLSTLHGSSCVCSTCIASTPNVRKHAVTPKHCV